MKSLTLFPYLLLLAFSPILTLILHALLVRLTQKLDKKFPTQLQTALAILAGYPVVGIIAWWTTFKYIPNGNELWIPAVYGILVYSFLAYAYFHLFNLSETSRRARILYELKRNGPMTQEAVEAEYSPAGQIFVRLERLVDIGELKIIDGRYCLKRYSLWFVAFILKVWGKLIGFKL